MPRSRRALRRALRGGLLRGSARLAVAVGGWLLILALFGIPVAILAVVGIVAVGRVRDRRRRAELARSAPVRAFAAAVHTIVGWTDPRDWRRWFPVEMWPEPGSEREPGSRVVVRFAPGWPCDARQRARIAEMLADRLGGDWATSVDWTHCRLNLQRLPAVEQPRLPRRVDFGQLSGSRDRVPLGVLLDGRPLVWDLALDAHALVAGRTGAGKTNLLRLVIAHVAAFDGLVDVIDAKRSIDFDVFDGARNIRVWTEPDDLARIVCDYRDEMAARYRDIRAGGDPASWPRRLLVIDEGADFVGAVRQAWDASRPRGATGQPPALAALATVLRQSRAADMHVLEGCQQPNATVTAGTEGRAQFALKIAVGRVDPPLAQMLFGDRVPPPAEGSVRGRGVVEVDGEFVPVQTAYLDPVAAPKIAARGRPGFPRRRTPPPTASPTAVPTPPAPKRVPPTPPTPPTAVPPPYAAAPRVAVAMACLRCGLPWQTNAKPGTAGVRCPHCGHKARVPKSASPVEAPR